MNRIEALADALAHLNGFHDPLSEAYQLRNPGMLKAFSIRHRMSDSGHRIFPSLIDGLQALYFDLKLKCTGKSRSKLGPNSTLEDLVTVYGQKRTAAQPVVKFLRRSIAECIDAETPLSFFTEE